VTSTARIDNRQTPMPEAYLLPVVVDRWRDPRAFVVTPAMLNSREHRANSRFRIS
jgi:hypothetical protein